MRLGCTAFTMTAQPKVPVHDSLKRPLCCAYSQNSVDSLMLIKQLHSTLSTDLLFTTTFCRGAPNPSSVSAKQPVLWRLSAAPNRGSQRMQESQRRMLDRPACV